MTAWLGISPDMCEIEWYVVSVCWLGCVGRMLMTESLAMHQDTTHKCIHTYIGAHKHLVHTHN